MRLLSGNVPIFVHPDACGRANLLAAAGDLAGTSFHGFAQYVPPPFHEEAIEGLWKRLGRSGRNLFADFDGGRRFITPDMLAHSMKLPNKGNVMISRCVNRLRPLPDLFSHSGFAVANLKRNIDQEAALYILTYILPTKEKDCLSFEALTILEAFSNRENIDCRDWFYDKFVNAIKTAMSGNAGEEFLYPHVVSGLWLMLNGKSLPSYRLQMEVVNLVVEMPEVVAEEVGAISTKRKRGILTAGDETVARKKRNSGKEQPDACGASPIIPIKHLEDVAAESVPNSHRKRRKTLEKLRKALENVKDEWQEMETEVLEETSVMEHQINMFKKQEFEVKMKVALLESAVADANRAQESLNKQIQLMEVIMEGKDAQIRLQHQQIADLKKHIDELKKELDRSQQEQKGNQTSGSSEESIQIVSTVGAKMDKGITMVP